ncbi:MAG TPA: hypothetical protein VJH92_00965 [Candidatus Nanoarchaeia archaeon]|nr:hypothetical protein [Candidatus Nanoarchaeia archaeon]
MPTLASILKKEKFGNGKTVDENQEVIACAVKVYLNSHRAVLSSDIEDAFVEVVKGNSLYYPFPLEGVQGAYLHSWAAAFPTSNPALRRESFGFSSMPLRDAALLVITPEKKSDIAITPGRTTVYYKSEEALREYMSARLTKTGRIVHYTFSEKPAEPTQTKKAKKS